MPHGLPSAQRALHVQRRGLQRPRLGRARVAELMRIVQAIKRGKAGYKIDGARIDFAHPVSVADVFEAFVMPHMVTRDYQPAAA